MPPARLLVPAVLASVALLVSSCSVLFPAEESDGTDFIPQELTDLLVLPSVDPAEKSAALEAHLTSEGLPGPAIAEMYVVQGHACVHPRIGSLPEDTLMTDLSPAGPTFEAHVAAATGYSSTAARSAASSAVWAAMQVWCPSQAAHAFGSPVRLALNDVRAAVDAALLPEVDWSDRHSMLAPERTGMGYLYRRLGLDDSNQRLATQVASALCSTEVPEQEDEIRELASSVFEEAVLAAGPIEMESFSDALAEGPARLTSPADHMTVLLLPGLLHCPANGLMTWLYESVR